MPRPFCSMVFALWTAVALTGCHGMNPFAADLGRTDLGGKTARAPYMSQFSYLGFFEPEAPSTAEAAQGSSRAIYFWLPVSTPELGVRFVSGGTHSVAFDAHKDVAEPAYGAHSKDAAFFDSALEVQRCLTVLDPADVDGPCSQWVTLGNNDDSPEMPANPEGQLTNSLVRVGTHPEDPLKALGRGLYRVNVQGAKKTTPRGKFVLQLGAPVLLDAVAMARTPEALAQALRAQVRALADTPSIGHQGFAVPLEGTAAPLEPSASESP